MDVPLAIGKHRCVLIPNVRFFARDRAKRRFVPESNFEAFKAFSDGVFFYRQEVVIRV